MSIFNYLKAKLFHFEKTKEVAPEVTPEIPKKPPKKGSPEDFAAFFEEMRKTLWIIKNATAHLYVEWQNLKDKWEKKIESQNEK